MSTAQPLSGPKAKIYPELLAHWQERGVSLRASSALALACVETVEQLTELGRAFFEGRPNVGPKTLAELTTLAGWATKTPVDAISAALKLSIADPGEAREAATDAVIALHRSGFVISAQRSVLAGRRQLGK